MKSMLMRMPLPNCLLLAGAVAMEFGSGVPGSWDVSFPSPIGFLTVERTISTHH
jgi:hypothetical protein